MQFTRISVSLSDNISRVAVGNASMSSLFRYVGGFWSGVTSAIRAKLCGGDPHAYKRRSQLFFRKQILRGERFRDRLHIGLDRRLHVRRLRHSNSAGPHQFVLGDVVERGL